MSSRRLIALMTAFTLALGVAACGEREEEEEAASAPAATATAEATEEAAAPEDQEISKDTETKPTIPAPSGEPPAELVKEDVVEGKGKAAKAGDTVSVQYVGVSFSTGQEFDASWDRGEPFEFELGAGSVITGWDEGVPGMKVGGRRKLVIPPDQGYGPQGSPPAIGPNETLIFVVDQLDVK